MPEVLNQLETLTIPHPGHYDIQVVAGGPVAYFADGEVPKSVANGHATVESAGRLHLIATGNALVSISEHVRKVSPRKTASSTQAQPEPARKASGRSAKDPDQAPAATSATPTRPSRAKQRPAGKTNKPTRSQAERKAGANDQANRRSR